MNVLKLVTSSFSVRIILLCIFQNWTKIFQNIIPYNECQYKYFLLNLRQSIGGFPLSLVFFAFCSRYIFVYDFTKNITWRFNDIKITTKKDDDRDTLYQQFRDFDAGSLSLFPLSVEIIYMICIFYSWN